MQNETRRSFLSRMGRVGLAAALAKNTTVHAADRAVALPALGSRPSTGPIDETAKSLVAHVRRPEVIDAKVIHQRLLGEMIEDGLCVVAGAARPADAWNTFFDSNDTIGIKLNQIGFAELGTAEYLATEMVRSLGEAGFAPERIMLIEAPSHLVRRLKTRPRPFGWSGGEVAFGSGAEELAALLQEVTALVNVPFLKTHNVAGMTGCLKNLSHALVRRPARYHANACTPFVGDIVALPQIRSKLRLNVVNAVHAVFDNGPAVQATSVWPHAGLLLSTDPVAADSVGIDILNEQRVRAKLPAIGNAAGQIPHVHHAARIGLGTDDQDYINLVDVPLA